MIFLSGCAQKSDLEKAQDRIRRSQADYQAAVNLYQALIAKGKDAGRLHFELGKLYYDRKEFALAATEFKGADTQEAKKYLAISYYHLNDFTGALGIFNKLEPKDEECLYYYGLTCEKMNLYDQALEAYKKIKASHYSELAAQRLLAIEKQKGAVNIKDIDPAAADILNASPEAEQYPQAGALILHCDESIQISSENTQTASLHYVIKILNERGKESFSETQIDYDSTYERVELEYARTIKPDGTVADVGSRHIRDVSKYLNFPLYSNARVYIISFPEITEGASIEYKLKIQRNELINKKDFMVSYPLQTSEPVVSARFRLEVPEAKGVFIKNLNEKYNDFAAELTPQVRQVQGKKIYEWEFRDIPQILPESNMPPAVEINPTLLISSFDNWQDIYRWWWALARDRLVTDQALKDKTHELLRGLSSEADKARAIYNFCAQKIRYVAVEYGQAGYQPHYASDIFKNKYGDCKDQAILLVTMLREAGFKAYPVLISTRDYYNPHKDFPAVFFNHCIAAISLNEQLVFMDPTAETCPFADLPVDDQGRSVLVIRDDAHQIEQTPLYEAGHNVIRQDLKIKINEDESILGQKAISTLGMYEQAQRFWLLYTPPELIREQIQERLQEVSVGAQLEEYHIKNLESLNTPIVLDYTFKGTEYLTAAGDLRIMPQFAQVASALVSRTERRYPIDFAALDTKEAVFEIELPPGFSVRYLPDDIVEDSRWLKFSASYEYKAGRVYFKQNTQLKNTKVSEEEYPEFKTFFEALARKVKQRLVLREKR